MHLAFYSGKHAPFLSHKRFFTTIVFYTRSVFAVKKYEKMKNKKGQTHRSIWSIFCSVGRPGGPKGHLGEVDFEAFARSFPGIFSGTPLHSHIGFTGGARGAKIVIYHYKSSIFKQGPGAPQTNIWTARKPFWGPFWERFRTRSFQGERPQTNVGIFCQVSGPKKTQKIRTNSPQETLIHILWRKRLCQGLDLLHHIQGRRRRHRALNVAVAAARAA